MEDDKFLKLLLQTFAVEAREHLAAMSQQLLALEGATTPSDASGVVETLFREVHSLKGAARSVNLSDIERVCQPMERVLSSLKRGELAVTPGFFEAMYAATDGLGRILARDVGEGSQMEPGLPATLANSMFVLLGIGGATGKGSTVGAPIIGVPTTSEPVLAPPPAPAPAIVDGPVASQPAATSAATAAPAETTVRIAIAKVDALMAQSQELQALKLGGAHLAEELQGIADMLATWRRGFDKRAGHARLLKRNGGVEALDNPKNKRLLARLLDAFDSDELFVKSLADRMGRVARAAAQDRRVLASRIDRLVDEVRQASMLPFSSLFTALPKLVRDLAHDSGKDVALEITGASLEADRRILEQLRTPLTHLVRNAIDHGIETPAQRVRDGKSPRGRLTVAVSAREGGRVELAISDDGAGVDVERVRGRALKMGLRSEEALAQLDAAQSAQLIFESGLSTSPILTDLSGHGLGLAIVREKVLALGGTITVGPADGNTGTRFVIVLPSALATFHGLLVQTAGRAFVFPSSHVERVFRMPPSSVQSAQGVDSVAVQGDTVRVASLALTLGLQVPPGARRPAYLQFVALHCNGERLAFVVDEVVGDQEVLVQPLVAPLRRVPNISAATVIGAQVVPLLNVADLFKSADAMRAGEPAPWRTEPREHAVVSLLVAEDSVTARTQLRQILESAGYSVTTAADGMEALANLQSGEFDLLVTDVEMPRLDGFGLTARVRRDQRLADLPVILVTALDSREDKERGVEVGANAYIVKRGFDQQRLLDTIRTLL